jgi:hypothetical protein
MLPSDVRVSGRGVHVRGRKSDAHISTMLHFLTVGFLAARLGSHFTITCRAKFPAGREKCREFRRISLFSRKSVAKRSAKSAICETIPYAGEQGIKLPQQGIYFAFSTGAGNLAPNRFLRPKYPIEANIISAKSRRPTLLEDFNEGKFDCGRHIGRRFPGDRRPIALFQA